MSLKISNRLWWIVVALQLSSSCKNDIFSVTVTINNMIIITKGQVLLLSSITVIINTKSDTQLTSPDEIVCVGQEVVFTCQQTGMLMRWTVNLPNITLTISALSSQAGRVSNFIDDPGFGFEIHVLPSTSSGSRMSELHVTAVEELDEVTVECLAQSETFMSTIQIVSVPG